MLVYVIQRLMQAALVMLAMSALVFAGVYIGLNILADVISIDTDL